jgi:hypothetical protein
LVAHFSAVAIVFAADRNGVGVTDPAVQDVEDFIQDAYRKTAERIAAGELKDDIELERMKNSLARSSVLAS